MPRRMISVLASVYVLACGGASSDGSTVDTYTEVEDVVGDEWLLNAFVIPGSSDICVVGGSSERGAAIYCRRDGAWDKVDHGLGIASLNWGFALDETRVYVVSVRGEIGYFDGLVWSEMVSPTREPLWGIWGAADDDIWAVGGFDATPVLIHYDGNNWNEAAYPDLVRGQVNAFYKVWGTRSGNVYVVGQSGVIMHWDGSEWVEQGAGTGEDLIALWGTDANHIVAVGGRGNGVVATFDGDGWRSQSLSPTPGLNGVWMHRADRIHAVGIEGTAIEMDFETLEPRRSEVPTRLDLHGIVGLVDARLVAVGGNLGETGQPQIGVLLEQAFGIDD